MESDSKLYIDGEKNEYSTLEKPDQTSIDIILEKLEARMGLSINSNRATTR